MVEVNPSRFKYPPLSYQAKGLRDVLSHKAFALFWEMRLRKSKVIVDAAGSLFEAGKLDTVIVVCPAQVKDVWLGRQFGEIVKHSFVQSAYAEYDANNGPQADGKFKTARWVGDIRSGGRALAWVVTSFEFLRQEDEYRKYLKVEALIDWLKGQRAWLVIDESAAISNHKAAQSKAVIRLRTACERVTLLDGTPDDGTPEPLYNKFRVLDPNILGFKNFHHFLAIHGVVKEVKYGSRKFRKVVGYRKLDRLAALTAPYCSVIKQEDVKGILDLPAFEPAVLTARLSDKSWKVYKQMRDQMIAELDTSAGEEKISWTRHAATKVLRLAQICAGFLGGVEGEESAVEIGSEATDTVLDWLKQRLIEDPQFKCVIWCRWRPEIKRLVKLLGGEDYCRVGQQWGDVKDENFLHPDNSYSDAGVMVCQPQAVKYGVSFAKATAQVFSSSDYNLVTRQQAEQRVQDDVKKIGRTTTLLVDLLACGPDGQQTVTHDIVSSMQNKINVSKRLTAEWRKVISAE